MKKLIFSNLFAIVLLQNAFAQAVGETDIAALLNEMPAPPTSLADAYARAYPTGETYPDALLYYKPWTSKVESAGQEIQALQRDFYKKYPMGVRPQTQPQQAPRATPQQQASMDAATSELAHKMMNDPAFAQEFMKMSEQEQHAYIAKLLADKGLKPASGTPNVNTAPVAGTDIEWGTFCSDYSMTAMDMSRWEAQTALQQKYQAQHDEINAWSEAEINKLPMISFGEYGHDHDPEQVKAIKKQALAKHRDVAEAMLKEAIVMFAQFRQQSQQRIAPLNDALKNVNYGANYDFGNHYTTVLGVQLMMLGDLDTLLKNEVNIVNECARWEYDLRNFK